MLNMQNGSLCLDVCSYMSIYVYFLCSNIVCVFPVSVSVHVVCPVCLGVSVCV